MADPVSGPYQKVVTSLGPPNAYGYRPQWVDQRRTWYRQKRPYNKVLPFSFFDARVVGFGHYGDESNTASVESSCIYGWPQDLYDNSYNNAYAKLKGKLSESAALSVTLAERKQAMGMVANRANQLYQFTRSLRRLDFSGAARHLGLSKPPGKRKLDLRRDSKALANNYLEFHFGWSPLVMDIGNAVETLQSGVPPAMVRARSVLKRTDIVRPNPNWIEQLSYECGTELQTEVWVDNPNLWLANQLGFVNPATVAWELVPFSFVVDWFVNVGDFLSSWTDFAGLSLRNARITRLDRGSYFSNYSPGAPYGRWFRGNSVRVSRSPVASFPGPTLGVRSPWTLSPRRGLAAISLLVQQLK